MSSTANISQARRLPANGFSRGNRGPSRATSDRAFVSRHSITERLMRTATQPRGCLTIRLSAAKTFCPATRRHGDSLTRSIRLNGGSGTIAPRIPRYRSSHLHQFIDRPQLLLQPAPPPRLLPTLLQLPPRQLIRQHRKSPMSRRRSFQLFHLRRRRTARNAAKDVPR